MPSTPDARLAALASELNSVAVHLVRRLRRTDRTLGVAPARLSALSVLVFGGPCGVGALAEAEQVSGPTMSKIVAALEADGLIRRTRDPVDGRAVVLDATPRGRKLMERGRRRRTDRLVRELRALSRADLGTLEQAVRILRSLE
jgi:DNA-binding MarR family transcriptional regulator